MRSGGGGGGRGGGGTALETDVREIRLWRDMKRHVVALFDRYIKTNKQIN